MYERRITEEEVIHVIEHGEVVEDYPDDYPYPSSLILGLASGRSIHVVVAVEPGTKTCYIITVYLPDPERWASGFKTRRR
jgi:hypothetical protein